MRKKLSLELRRELLTRTAEDYASARKGIKSQIVDQLVAATGYGRKYAITLLNHPPGSVSSSRPRRARYDERVKRALVTLWTTANRICAKRLVPFLPELIEVMERNGHLSLPADVRAKLLTISSAPADRLLATERSNQRGVSTTRPGSLLKKQIKVRTFADWDDLQPGDQRSWNDSGHSADRRNACAPRRSAALRCGAGSVRHGREQSGCPGRSGQPLGTQGVWTDGVFYLSRKSGTIRSGNLSTGRAMNNYVYRVTEKKDFGSPGEPGENFEAFNLSEAKRISTRRQKVKGTVLVLEDVTDEPHVVATKDEHGKWADADETP